MPLLLIALILVPLAEIAVFIQIGGWIGLAPTLLAVVLTAVLGAILLRRQGLHTIQEAQLKLNRQEVPIRELLDGLCLFAAGAFLLTPGFLTDGVGFVLLVPMARAWIAARIWRRLIERGAAASTGADPFRRSDSAPSNDRPKKGPVIDAEFEELPDDDRTGTRPRDDSRWGQGPNSS